MIYVDSNVIIDTLSNDPSWGAWSIERLEAGRAADRLVTGPVVAAEVAHYLESLDALEMIMARLEIALAEVGLDAAWSSGQAYREYRKRGGDRPSLLPDFLIGGHAAALGATVLTRDPRRYRSYFPDLTLITPETDNG